MQTARAEGADPASRLMPVSGSAAFIGGLMWIYKSLGILLTGDQPDYVFEVAPAFFGASLAVLVYALRRELRRPAIVLAWPAAVGGVMAASAYVIDGNDEGLFGPGARLCAHRAGPSNTASA